MTWEQDMAEAFIRQHWADNYCDVVFGLMDAITNAEAGKPDALLSHGRKLPEPSSPWLWSPINLTYRDWSEAWPSGPLDKIEFGSRVADALWRAS